MTYQEIVTTVMTAFNDAEQRSIETDFILQAVELCLFILLVTHKPTVSTHTHSMQSSVPLDPFSFMPIIDVNVHTNKPEITLPVSVRDANNKHLAYGNTHDVEYIHGDFSTTRSAPADWYMIFSNLLGVRPAPATDQNITIVYVPYIEVLSLESNFDLDDSFAPHMQQLLKAILLLRISRIESAQMELSRFLEMT